MARPKGSFKDPTYRLHKSSGQACTSIGGKVHYLGPHNTTESRQKFHQLVGEYHARGGIGPSVTVDEVTVTEMVAAFWAWAKVRYAASGSFKAFTITLRTLRELYGPVPAAEFSPLKLKAVRQHLLARTCVCGPNTGDTLSRKVVNDRIKQVQHIFAWAAENEIVPGATLHALLAVRGLSPNESKAPELPPVRSANEDLFLASLDHLPAVVRDMVQLQRYTGMRCGEVFVLRGIDLDTSDPEVWIYKVPKHKTQHLGKERVVVINKRAQGHLRPWLKPDLTAIVFTPDLMRDGRLYRHGQSPQAAEGKVSVRLEYYREWARRRRRKLGTRTRQVCPVFTSHLYSDVLKGACDRAFPPPDHLARQIVTVPVAFGKGTKRRRELVKHWRARLGEEKWAELRAWQRAHRWRSHQLRHSFATDVEQAIGKRAARILLGHEHETTTTSYIDPTAIKEMKNLALMIG